MSDKKLTDDDIKIWTKAISNIEKHKLSKSNAQLNVRAKQKENKRKIKPLLIDKTLKTPNTLLDKHKLVNENSKNSKIDKKVLSKIKSGKLVPEETLDLHGYTLISAKKILLKFLFRAYSNRRRLILIITGKGKPKAISDINLDYKGVLRKEVPFWLMEPGFSEIILSVSTAHQKHGGAGAVYVYLKRNKMVL
ncbi:MAG: Smr/MutS family protein [Paracoccaceae bacterium]